MSTRRPMSPGIWVTCTIRTLYVILRTLRITEKGKEFKAAVRVIQEYKTTRKRINMMLLALTFVLLVVLTSLANASLMGGKCSNGVVLSRSQAYVDVANDWFGWRLLPNIYRDALVLIWMKNRNSCLLFHSEWNPYCFVFVCLSVNTVFFANHHVLRKIVSLC